MDPCTPALAASDLCLWPPNHRYVCFTDLGALLASDSETCGLGAVRVTACDSDQPEDQHGADDRSISGDGHTRDDCVVADDGTGFCVRSERCGTGPTAQDGRHYGVGIIAADACGNQSPPAVIGNIHVPHDQSPPERECIDPTKEGERPGGGSSRGR